MTEILNLTAPNPTTDRWRVKGLRLERGLSSDTGPIILTAASSIVVVDLIGENGRTSFYRWTGANADADIVALNKARLDLISLEKRLLNKLIADGIHAGTVSGSPD